MRKGGTLIVIAIAILGLWATSAFACHITANCYTATLVDNWHDDRITVRYVDGYQTVLETHNLETQVPNNGPHGHVSSAGFHNGNEWRYVSAPYGCVRPTTTTTTTVAPTTTTSTTEAPVVTTTTLAPTTTSTTIPASSTTLPQSTTTVPGTPPTTAVAPNPTTSTTSKRDIGGPPASVMSPPAPPTDELPHTGSNGLVPVAAVGAVLLLAGLACVASKKKAQR